jgi:hypothetical protein
MQTLAVLAMRALSAACPNDVGWRVVCTNVPFLAL